MGNSKIEVHFDNRKMELKTALIGGVLDDGTNCPMGMYAGHLEIGEIGMALMHSHRAILKLLVDQHKMGFQEAQDFVCFCLAEASRREEKKKPEENISLDMHEMYVKMAKERM